MAGMRQNSGSHHASCSPFRSRFAFITHAQISWLEQPKQDIQSSLLTGAQDTAIHNSVPWYLLGIFGLAMWLKSFKDSLDSVATSSVGHRKVAQALNGTLTRT